MTRSEKRELLETMEKSQIIELFLRTQAAYEKVAERLHKKEEELEALEPEDQFEILIQSIPEH